MTLHDDLTRTAALLRAGWPIANLARAKRAQERQMLTDDQRDDLEDLIERATPILTELRRACSRPAKFEAHDDDLAAALVAVEPRAMVELHGRTFYVETPEFRITSNADPRGVK